MSFGQIKLRRHGGVREEEREEEREKEREGERDRERETYPSIFVDIRRPFNQPAFLVTLLV